MYFTPAFSAASTIATASSILSQTGFSVNMCLPASAQAMTISLRLKGSVHIQTASTFGRSSRKSVQAFEPVTSAAFFALSSTRSQQPTISTPSTFTSAPA